MTIKALFPSSEPALELDFANTKALDPRVTFTRVMTGASVATFVGADGLIKTARNNVPRFEHNPTTGESLGLLVEGAATNSLWPSEPTTAASRNSTGSPGNTWAVYDGTVSSASRNTINGLEVTISSTLDNNGFVSGNATNWGGIGGGGNHATATVASVSLFINPLTWTGNIWIGRLAQDGNDTSAARNFQLFNNGIYTGPASNLKAIFPDGTYWLHNIPWPSLSVDVSPGQFLVLFTTTPGDNVKKFWAGGFQWEAGSVSTSYIPTVASAVTRAADVATVSNANSSVFPTSAFTTVNSPFGTAGGGSTVKLVGPTIKRTAIYAGDLPQVQINALTNTGDFWRWRVLGSSFALPGFTTNGSVTVDWGDGTVQTLTTGVYTFTNGGGYHDIGFRLNSGTFFRPNIATNATYKDRVIAVGPAPASMKVDGRDAFWGCTALRRMDGYVDFSPTTNLNLAWLSCSSLVEFPLVNTSSATNMNSTWGDCSGLTSFPLISTGSVTTLSNTWSNCYGLTSFPLINTGSATNLSGTWYNNVSLTSFPLINTANVTNFGSTWFNNNKLTSFPLINTAAGTNFYETWNACSSLTSFPLINTGAGTTFERTWNGCTGLTSFPLINTAAGTSFLKTWQSCTGLTSFPLINTAAGTNFQEAWNGCSGLTSFPLISTAAGTNFSSAWNGCSSLTSFPLINTGAGTNFQNAWRSCSALTSFPLINTAAGTNFGAAWFPCSGLTSFPLISTSNATNLAQAWEGCVQLASFPTLSTASVTSFFRTWFLCSSLASFPSINMSSGTDFQRAWDSCSSLTTFPPNMFNTTGALVSTAFLNSFTGCSLTAASIENVLTSLVVNGQSNITLGIQGGGNAGASTWTANAVTAYNTLISRGWTISRNA